MTDYCRILPQGARANLRDGQLVCRRGSDARSRTRISRSQVHEQDHLDRKRGLPHLLSYCTALHALEHNAAGPNSRRGPAFAKAVYGTPHGG